MKTINAKATAKRIQYAFEVMQSAQSREQLDQAYYDLDDVLRSYYQACVQIAEYNELVAKFNDAPLIIPAESEVK